MERVVNEKMEMELQLADIVDGHNITAQQTRQTTRLKMNKIKKYALRNEMCLQYSFGAIVILVAVITAMLGTFTCGKK